MKGTGGSVSNIKLRDLLLIMIGYYKIKMEESDIPWTSSRSMNRQDTVIMDLDADFVSCVSL